MRQQTQRRAAGLTPMMVGLRFLILQSQPAVSRDCDCSCETYSAFVSGVREGGRMTPEPAELAGCYASCLQQWQQCQSKAKAEAEEQTWDCEKEPNSPVERGECKRACGKDTDPGVWASRPGQPRDDLVRFYGRCEGADIEWAEFQIGADNSASAMILDTEYQDRVRYEHVSGDGE